MHFTNRNSCLIFWPCIFLTMSLVEQEMPTLPEHMSSPPVFSWVRVTRSLALYLCFVDRCLSFCTFFWPLCCLFFFYIRILISPFVSSNPSRWLINTENLISNNIKLPMTWLCKHEHYGVIFNHYSSLSHYIQSTFNVIYC